MKTFLCLIILCFHLSLLHAQRMHIGVAGGLSNYNGDLMDKPYHSKMTNGFIGLTIHYEVQDKILVRGAYNFARVNGSDIYSEKENLRMRNLSFESPISEISLVGEYYLFNLYERRFSPYVFLGLAAYHFNPYSYDTNGTKVFLKPLKTEGQGIIPGKKEYALWQMAIPIGGGVKFSITENIRVGIELGMRKLFTDYLDDVSTNYPDYNELLAAQGQTAVDFSYRGDEVPGGDPVFPAKGTQRGGFQQRDIYYFTGLNISFRLPFGSGGNGGGGFGKKNKFGCPKVPL